MAAYLDKKAFAQAKSTADPILSVGENQRKKAERDLFKKLGRAPRLDEVRQRLRDQLRV